MPQFTRGKAREPSEEEPTSSPPLRAKLCCSARMAMSIVSFINLFNVSFCRIMISIALVCMSGLPRLHHASENMKREFHWSPSVFGHITSAAFYGFILGPFFGGFLSFKYGGKLVMLVSTLFSGFFTLLVPEGTRLTVYYLFLLRVFIGFFSSFGFPAFYDLVSHWIVEEERQFLVTFTLVSIPLANILNFPINSVICVYLGWVWIFYIFGVWLCLFSFVIGFTIYNHPSQCKYITPTELIYLESKIPRSIKRSIPWKKIMTSMSIYAFIVIHFSVTYVYLNMIFSIPFLLEQIFDVPVKEVGLLSALPFMGSLIVRILLSIFYDKIRKKLLLTKNIMRKICILIGCCLVSLNYMAIILLPSGVNVYWILLCFIFASSSLELVIIGGYLLSLLDICPSYVNVMTGVTNTLGNTAGLIGPVVTGFLTSRGKKEEWNYVFYVNITILNLAMLFYLVFGSNKLEPWGLVREDEDEVNRMRKASKESVYANV